MPLADLSGARQTRAASPPKDSGNCSPGKDLPQARAQAESQRVIKTRCKAAVRGQHRLEALGFDDVYVNVLFRDYRAESRMLFEEGDFPEDLIDAVTGDGNALPLDNCAPRALGLCG